MTISNDAFDVLALQLYRSVREVPFAQFQEHALRLVKPVLGFDTAIWGMGTSNGCGGFISSVYLHALPPQMMDDYAGEVQSQDLAAERTTLEPGRTVCIPLDDPEMASERRAAARAYLRKYGLTHLLCTALPEPALGLSHFLTLARSDPARPWTEASRQYMERLFPHLIEAYIHARCLHMAQHNSVDRGQAVADRTLRIVTITPVFRELMLREWPGWVDWRLPPEVCAEWSDGSDLPGKRRYKGAQVIIDMEPDQQLVLLTVRTRNALDVLSTRELAVARLFAQGLVGRAIAEEMGISPHTVRNQLKAAYIKLGVNSKTALAACLGELS